VAGAALLAAQDVSGGFGRRSDARPRRVAGETRARRAIEDGIDVARLARLHPVRSGQLVARRDVIELPARSLREDRAAGEHAEQQHEDEADSAHGMVLTASLLP